MYTGIELQPNFEPCECCKIRYTTMTCTTHKWTEQEVKDEILHIASELSKAKWYNRGHLLENLKHWQSKLDKLNDVKADFDLSS